VLVAAAIAAVCLSGDGLGAPAAGPPTEVVVTLQAAPAGRSLQSAARLRVAQATAIRTVQRAIPGAQVHWRYNVVLDGFSVVVPRGEISRLASLPGLTVWPNVTYHALDGPAQIGAPQLWGPTLATAGQGIKIGIIDDGLDASNPYFSPVGFAYPAGFPKGQVKYATAKVIVQRAFPAPGQTWKYANTPFDPVNSDHATHVAGIAAGDHGTKAGAVTLSGVAPAAYLGNYKALTVPTSEFGLDGNSASIAAAIEAAVRDGMNVLNLSIGEPEVEPSRDLVVQALENAVRAGVVPVVAAGNDFGTFGYGSVTSPATTPDAISVASDDSHGVIASDSSAGPTAISLQMKPDVTAPGVNVLSSLPDGQFGIKSGTSMATPHVSGAVALLRQRHPAWTVAQIKSALVQTGNPVREGEGGLEARTTREGGGQVDLPRADNPLLFAVPTGLAFGQLAPGAGATRAVSLTDAGGGAGTWNAAAVVQGSGAKVTVPASVTVPGAFTVSATAGGTTGDVTGFVVLTRGTDVRRIPFWLAVSSPKLGTEPHITLMRPGVYHGTTVGGASLVSRYRYPTGGDETYPGPERVYLIHLTGHPANAGVVVLSGRVTPHVVFDGSEDRLTGYPGLPLDINPYREAYGSSVPTAGVVLPANGAYDVVFESRGAPGPFSFRYWVGDTRRPTLRLLAARGGIRVAATDAGSGVAPRSISATVDGTSVPVTWLRGVVRVPATRGRHRLVLTVADWQETKNMEDVPPVLPNTATLRATVTVR
jgi:subtilisin family serine protease